MSKVAELLMQHGSVKKFTDEKIDDATLEKMLLAGQQSSTSMNAQVISAIIVRDKAKLQAITDLAWGMKYIAESGAFVVLVADFNKTKYATDKVGKFQEVVKSPESILTGAADAGIFAQSMVAVAEDMGYGACYIGVIRADIEKMCEILELPKYVIPIFGLTIGRKHPDAKKLVKPRLPKTSFIHHDKYDDSHYAKDIEEYDKQLKEFYNSRGMEGEDWTQHIAGFFSKNYFPKVLAALKKQGFEMSE